MTPTLIMQDVAYRKATPIATYRKAGRLQVIFAVPMGRDAEIRDTGYPGSRILGPWQSRTDMGNQMARTRRVPSGSEELRFFGPVHDASMDKRVREARDRSMRNRGWCRWLRRPVNGGW